MRAWRRLITRLMLAAYLAMAPSWVESWRWDLRFRPIAVLSIGEPTPSIDHRER